MGDGGSGGLVVHVVGVLVVVVGGSGGLVMGLIGGVGGWRSGDR